MLFFTWINPAGIGLSGHVAELQVNRFDNRARSWPQADRGPERELREESLCTLQYESILPFYNASICCSNDGMIFN